MAIQPHWERLPCSLLSYIAQLIAGTEDPCRVETLLRRVCAGWSVSLPLSEGWEGRWTTFSSFREGVVCRGSVNLGHTASAAWPAGAGACSPAQTASKPFLSMQTAQDMAKLGTGSLEWT